MPNAILLDHFANPRNIGELPPPAVTVEVVNPACGDILRLSLAYEAGQIMAARFKTRGCAASIAASSALTEMLQGRKVAEARSIARGDIEAAVGGLPPESQHVAALCMDALQRALAAIDLK